MATASTGMATASTGMATASTGMATASGLLEQVTVDPQFCRAEQGGRRPGCGRLARVLASDLWSTIPSADHSLHGWPIGRSCAPAHVAHRRRIAVGGHSARLVSAGVTLSAIQAQHRRTPRVARRDAH
eukprot:342107-Chlamydomonas_euryale.AAC.1